MSDYLYEVRISDGQNHPEWVTFFRNIRRLNARASGYAGIESVCLLKHHQDAESVQIICCEDMRDCDAVTVREVTRQTLRDDHVIWTSLVKRYFLPYGRFPNL